MSKGLAIIYDPHNLYQFLWYYCTYGSEKKWDVLCLPNGFKGQYMDSYCRKCGVFENIYCDDKDFLAVPLGQQLKIFLQMLGHAIIGQQKRFCRKFLNKYINTDEYDEINVMTDVGLVSGLAIGLGSQKKVVIMEDGTGDYLTRSYKNIFKNFFSLHAWKGFILSLLGYSNPGHYFPLRSTKNCIKYSSHPEIMKYNKYISNHKLYDFNNTNMHLFETCVAGIYGNMNNYNFDNYDTVLFTERLDDFFNNPKPYQKLLEDYISNNSKRILIKKHPRDEANYTFGNNVIADCFDQSIPAEVMLPYLNNKTLFFIPYSSIMLYLNGTNNSICSLYFDNIVTDKQSNFAEYPSKEKLKNEIESYGLSNYRIIELE